MHGCTMYNDIHKCMRHNKIESAELIFIRHYCCCCIVQNNPAAVQPGMHLDGAFEKTALLTI